MLEAIRKISDMCRTKPAQESHTNPQKRSRIKPRTIKNQQWMFTRLQIVSPFSEKSADEEITGARAKLASRVLTRVFHLPIHMPRENSNARGAAA